MERLKYKLTDREFMVFSTLLNHNEPLSASELASLTGVSEENIRSLCSRINGKDPLLLNTETPSQFGIGSVNGLGFDRTKKEFTRSIPDLIE